MMSPYMCCLLIRLKSLSKYRWLVRGLADLVNKLAAVIHAAHDRVMRANHGLPSTWELIPQPFNTLPEVLLGWRGGGGEHWVGTGQLPWNHKSHRVLQSWAEWFQNYKSSVSTLDFPPWHQHHSVLPFSLFDIVRVHRVLKNTHTFSLCIKLRLTVKLKKKKKKKLLSALIKLMLKISGKRSKGAVASSNKEIHPAHLYLSNCSRNIATGDDFWSLFHMISPE